MVPYWGPYLKSLGFDAIAIGQLMAVLASTKIIAPYLWGWLADRVGYRLRIIQITTFITMLCFAGVLLNQSWWWFACVMFLFGFFSNAGMPQFEVMTLLHLGDDHHRYSQIRLWGSIGFIITVLCTGPLLTWWGQAVLPYILLVWFGLAWLVTLLMPAAKEQVVDNYSTVSVWSIFKQPAVLLIFVAAFLMQVAYGPYYSFFSIYLEAHGYSKTQVGIYWAVGVIAEVIVFFYMNRLLPRYGAVVLMQCCLAFAVLRWVLTAVFVDQPVILFFSQTLHAFSFGMFHAVMINHVHRYFTGSLHGRGQALYSSITFGAGGALGSWLAGYSWDSWGGSATYLACAVIAAVGYLIARTELKTFQRYSPI